MHRQQWCLPTFSNNRVSHAGSSRKGKFAPLAVLVPRLGAGAILHLQPDLLKVCLAAMAHYAVCSSAAALWAALLAQLRIECHADTGTHSFPRSSRQELINQIWAIPKQAWRWRSTRNAARLQRCWHSCGAVAIHKQVRAASFRYPVS